MASLECIADVAQECTCIARQDESLEWVGVVDITVLDFCRTVAAVAVVAALEVEFEVGVADAPRVAAGMTVVGIAGKSAPVVVGLRARSCLCYTGLCTLWGVD